MKRRKTEPDSQPAQEQGEAGSNDEQPFFGLPNELACLIWCKLDQQSQHRFMCASRQVAKNPVILAQIQYLSCYAERNDPLYQLSSFPSQAQLRRLKVVSSSPEVTAQFVQAAAGSQRAQTLLGRVHELRFEERSIMDQKQDGLEFSMTLPRLCPGLQSLWLHRVAFQHPGCMPAMSHLATTLQQLRCSIQLPAGELQDSLQHLASLSLLTSLDIGLTRSCDSKHGAMDIAPMSSLGRLQRLEIRAAWAKLVGLPAVGQGCTQLTQLFVEAEALKVPKQKQEQPGGQGPLWPSLLEADVCCYRKSSIAATGLSSAPALQKLRFVGMRLDAAAVGSITSLTSLTIRGPPDDDPEVVDMSPLAALQQLRVLEIEAHEADLDGMHAIGRGCTQLTKLILSAAAVPEDPRSRPRTAAYAASIIGMWPALQEARFEGLICGSILALELEHAGNLRSLHYDIEWEEWIGPAIAELGNLLSLRELSILCTELVKGSEGVDFSYLATLQDLQQLSIHMEAPIIGMPALARGCTALESLSVSECKYEPGQGGVQQEQQEQQQGDGAGEGQAEEAQWWPSLKTVSLRRKLEPGAVAPLQLHRAMRLQSYPEFALQLFAGSPASSPEALGELCRQWAAAAEPSPCSSLELWVDREYPLEGAFACLAALAGHVTCLSLHATSTGPCTFELAHAEALARALPDLQVLHLLYGTSISGPAVTVLLTQLTGLTLLDLGAPCKPADELVQAAVTAQQQRQQQAQPKPLEVALMGTEWSKEDAEEAGQAVATALFTHAVGHPQVTISIDFEILYGRG